ncbi:hypothetical protein [Pseudoalteromonas marina]|uniref:Uncharacterized protein n=1 Tax=Pseudoalteromonas marina TaxID=267375 RepID=A0ABT9FC90_9GAMM|nr:hypothetical protein [Pseudoalteromonas marina]MDP2564402.1 hypothetical protein [Pseudoalteromonas marina]
MKSIKFILAITLITLSVSSNAFIGIKNTDENHPLEIDAQNLKFKKELDILNKIVSKMRETHLETKIISSSKNKSEIEINWYVNRKHISSFMKYKFSLYEGENPEKTKTTKSAFSRPLNNLYFNEKPLGQINGLTWELPNEGKKDHVRNQMFMNTKGFIKIKHKETQHFIPILTTAPASGCDGNIFDENPKILCMQNSNGVEGGLFIGQSLGFTNRITIPNLITKPNEITLSIVFFYKGAEI